MVFYSCCTRDGCVLLIDANRGMRVLKREYRSSKRLTSEMIFHQDAGSVPSDAGTPVSHRLGPLSRLRHKSPSPNARVDITLSAHRRCHKRSPLIELPINRASGHELSNAMRSEIHARACAGESYGAIARSKSLPRSTVSATVKTINTRPIGRIQGTNWAPNCAQRPGTSTDCTTCTAAPHGHVWQPQT